MLAEVMREQALEELLTHLFSRVLVYEKPPELINGNPSCGASSKFVVVGDPAFRDTGPGLLFGQLPLLSPKEVQGQEGKGKKGQNRPQHRVVHYQISSRENVRISCWRKLGGKA
ncbi:MAG: hypothetical protein NT154_47495 [Verrucomicrobia bacterium]|nr:hypothetical protein [Verrucomicrobiota bacterium]